MKPGTSQADITSKDRCVPNSDAKINPALLFAFSRELHGGLQIVTGMYPGKKAVKLRARFGETESETMSDIEPKQNKVQRSWHIRIQCLP